MKYPIIDNITTLSNSITTRDKTAIEKTFSGLIKIIHPNLEVTKEDVKLILDFAIECRKRVKDQLIKMDETFNEDPVHFEYTDAAGQRFNITTLEEINYPSFSSQQAEEVYLKEIEPQLASQSSSSVEIPQQILTAKTISIRENQTNVSYDNLFGAYLQNATDIIVVDPYIRHPYQYRNFIEFIKLVMEKCDLSETIKIHLKTFNEDSYIPEMIDTLDDLKESLDSKNIDFTYEFNEGIHDRSIQLNNGWTIHMGRGLDIWQRTNGLFDFAEYVQEQRLCKETQIIISSPS